MHHIYTQYFKTPYGELLLGSFEGELCLCDWRYRQQRATIDARICSGLNAEFVQCDNDVLQLARQQLGQYFQHQRQVFDIPLNLVGTTFQQKVWHGLLSIAFGQTCSYLELANTIGNKAAVRAVASANGANALSIIVPCHRIIGSNGKLVGYAGGIKAKADLLALECDLFNQ